MFENISLPLFFLLLIAILWFHVIARFNEDEFFDRNSREKLTDCEAQPCLYTSRSWRQTVPRCYVLKLSAKRLQTEKKKKKMQSQRISNPYAVLGASSTAPVLLLLYELRDATDATASKEPWQREISGYSCGNSRDSRRHGSTSEYVVAVSTSLSSATYSFVDFVCKVGASDFRLKRTHSRVHYARVKVSRDWFTFPTLFHIAATANTQADGKTLVKK